MDKERQSLKENGKNVQGDSENLKKRLWYALINFLDFDASSNQKLEEKGIYKGKRRYFADEGLGYSNLRSHSSTVPSRENLLLIHLRLFRNDDGDFEYIFFKIW